jgi:hypothetical protein
VVANPIADLTINEDSPNTLIELFPRVFNDPDIATNNDLLGLRVVNNSNIGLVSSVIIGTVLDLRLVANQNGQAVITLEATDRNSASVRDTFTLTVLAVNDPPNAVNDAFQVQANSSLNLNVLANDTDVDSTIDTASVQITSAPNNGSVTVNSDGTIRFTPATNFNGISKFRYTVADNTGAGSNEAEVTVTVNASPVAVNDQASTTQGVPVPVNVVANDTDSDGTVDPTTVTITRAPQNGTVAVNTTTGVVTYTPSSTFTGTDTFLYTVRDNVNGLSNQATVTISVTPTRFWQNQPNNLDVNDDGRVSPIDVLQVVNRLNSSGAGPLPVPTPAFGPPPFYDVNGDGNISPADALVVINAINEGSGGEGESGDSTLVGLETGAVVSTETYKLLVGSTFSEYRYIPLVSGTGHSNSKSELSGMVSRADRSTSESVDVIVTQIAAGVSVGNATSGLAFHEEDAAINLLTDHECTSFDSAVDLALGDLFGDAAEQ